MTRSGGKIPRKSHVTCSTFGAAANPTRATRANALGQGPRARFILHRIFINNTRGDAIVTNMIRGEKKEILNYVI